MGAVSFVHPVVAGGGDDLRLDVAALRAGMLLLACSGAGGLLNRSPLAVGVGRSHMVSVTDMVGVTVVLPVMAQSGDSLRPLVDMLRGSGMPIALIGASVLHPAIFRAGGILAADLFFGANIFAMDDLLLPAFTVVPQLRIIANGVYKAAGCGVISCAYRSLSTFHIDILSIRRFPWFHFKQHIVTDVDLGTGNRTIFSNYLNVIADLNFSVCSAVNVHYNFSVRIAPNIPAADTGASSFISD